jgi:hypothetical protein
MAEDILRQIRKENSNSDMDLTADIYNEALIMVEDLCLAITRSARDAVSRTAASIASAYRLSTSKITLIDLNSDLPGLDRLLKYKKMMRKLWQEARDPGCKTAFNRVSKAIRRMIQKKILEQWETKLENTELTPQLIWPIAKSLSNRDGPGAPTAIHGLLGLKYHPEDKANAIVYPQAL